MGSPSPTLPATSWDLAFALEAGSIGDLVKWNGGLLATGCAPAAATRCGQRLIVVSDDGLAWELVELAPDDDFGGGSIHRLGTRLFVVGYGYYGGYGGAKVWTSTDGRTWSRVRSRSFFGRSIRHFVKTPFGSFAIGTNAPVDSDNITGLVLWPVNPDGTFDAPIDVDTRDAPVLVYGSAWTGEELLGWGLRDGPMAGGPTVLLASRDGRSWSERARISSGRRTVVQGIVRIGERLVAVGYLGRHYPLTPAAWTSDDGGRSWKAAAVPGDDAQLGVVEVEGSRLIARGSMGWGATERAASWESADGTTWIKLAEDVDRPLVDGFRDWGRATVDGRTCVSGSFVTGAPLAAAIYCR